MAVRLRPCLRSHHPLRSNGDVRYNKSDSCFLAVSSENVSAVTPTSKLPTRLAANQAGLPTPWSW